MCGPPDEPEEGAALTVKVTVPVVDAAGELESVALIVSADAPAAVGVPESEQLVNVRPAGTVPLVKEQVYGALPPETPIVPV